MIDNTVYIAVGIPGCGKSTWWDQAIEAGTIPADSAMKINMDSIRKELTGSESDQSKNSQVATQANKQYELALSRKTPIKYWDNTSARLKYRRPLIKKAKEAGYRVVAIFFDVPLDVCKERNAARERVVPEDVLDRFYSSIQSNPPTLSEGYDEVIVVT